MMGIASIASTLADVIATPVTTWLENKKVESQGRIEIKKAKVQGAVKRASAGQEINAAWELKQIDNAGWKDEWVLLLISVPLVLCFGGTTGSEWARQGFAALNDTPDWYQYIVGVVLLASYGIKKTAPFINARGK